MGACGQALLLPPMLVIGGVLWLLPLMLLIAVNCLSRDKEETDVGQLYGCLEKIFLLAVAFLVASKLSYSVSIW